VVKYTLIFDRGVEPDLNEFVDQAGYEDEHFEFGDDYYQTADASTIEFFDYSGENGDIPQVIANEFGCTVRVDEVEFELNFSPPINMKEVDDDRPMYVVKGRDAQLLLDGKVQVSISL
jgi:hypothetical protein